MTGHDGTVAALKDFYRRAGLLDQDAGLPTERALTLDDAEEITGDSWYAFDRIGIDTETPASSAADLARLLTDVREGTLVWRAPEVL